MEQVNIVVITGLSGSGKSTAIDALEDLGYFCIDNLPVVLLPGLLATLNEDGRQSVARVGLGVDVRGGQFLAQAEQIFRQVMAEGHHLEILFLEADNDSIVRRFSATRRKHPLAHGGRLQEGVAAERRALADLRQMARTIIDTSDLTVHDLRRSVERLYNPDEGARARKMTVNVLSFGFKHGIPRGADLVFDVRFLSNPHFVPALRPHTGQRPEVAQYVMADPNTGQFLEHVLPMLRFLLPQYQQEGKHYLTVAFGCTGGKHRSVALAEHVFEHIRSQDGASEFKLHHRDIFRDTKA